MDLGGATEGEIYKKKIQLAYYTWKKLRDFGQTAH